MGFGHRPNNVNQMRLKGFLAGPLLLLIACKQPTTAEQLDTVLSWLGTAGMAADAWMHHTTPDRYTRQTLELSHKTIQQLAADLRKSPTPTPGVDTALLDTVLTRSGARLTEMARLVQDRNSPGVGSQLDSLRADEAIIKRLADAAASSQ